MNNPHNTECSREIMIQLDNLIRSINPYYEAYYTMKELMDQQNQDTEEDDLRMYIVADQRTHVASEGCNLRVVFRGPQEELPHNNFVEIKRRDSPNNRTNLTDLSPHRDPMVYPLLFPKGQFGFKLKMKQTNPLNPDDIETSKNIFYIYIYSVMIRVYNILLLFNL